jgi:hypothetical protein
MILTVEELLLIRSHFVITIHRVIFLLLWKSIKKQSIYIDVTKYQFTYGVELRRILDYTLYVPYAQFGTIKFLTPEKINKSRDYQVLVLSITNS